MFRLDTFAPGSYMAVAQTLAEGRQYRGSSVSNWEQTVPRSQFRSNRALTWPAASQSKAGCEAASDAYVTLVPGDGIPWRGEPLRATVNKDGTFRVTNVPPGVWTLARALSRPAAISSPCGSAIRTC